MYWNQICERNQSISPYFLDHFRVKNNRKWKHCCTFSHEILECQWLQLTHWGRVIHICVDKLVHHWYITVVCSAPSHYLIQYWLILDWTIGTETNFRAIRIEIWRFSCKKMHLKMPSAKWRPFCLDLNVLTPILESNTQPVITSKRGTHTQA